MKDSATQGKVNLKMMLLAIWGILLIGLLASVWFGNAQMVYGKTSAVYGGIQTGDRKNQTFNRKAPVSSLAERTTFTMNTVITIEAYGAEGADGARAAEERILELEKLWSVTDKESEIWQLNHSQGRSVTISPETEDLLSFALQMAEETDGSLNPAVYPLVRAWGFTTGEYRIPGEKELQELISHTDYSQITLSNGEITLPERMELDFGAIAKGYAGDQMAQVLQDNGVTSAIINIGGNVRLIGGTPEGENWKVGIISPYGEGNMGILEAQDVNIITSGGYERYFIGEDGKQYWHILDPKTGYPADSGILSATIIGKDGALCDALSTAAFVMGLNRAEEYWRSHDDFEMILMTKDNEIYVTEGLEGSFTLTEMSQGMPLRVVRR